MEVQGRIVRVDSGRAEMLKPGPSSIFRSPSGSTRFEPNSPEHGRPDKVWMTAGKAGDVTDDMTVAALKNSDPSETDELPARIFER